MTSPSRREVALAGHRGDQHRARQGLADPDPAVRATALGALQRMDHLDAGVLRLALVDQDPGVRRRAVQLAATFPEIDLVDLLRDLDPRVVEMAAWACGERTAGDERELDVLIELATDHADPLVREASVAALGAIGSPRGLPAILAATADKPAIRRRAVIALTPFDGPAVDEAFDRARTDRDWQVRQLAEELGPSS
jgi:HEAT repeat protein